MFWLVDPPIRDSASKMRVVFMVSALVDVAERTASESESPEPPVVDAAAADKAAQARLLDLGAKVESLERVVQNLEAQLEKANGRRLQSPSSSSASLTYNGDHSLRSGRCSENRLLPSPRFTSI